MTGRASRQKGQRGERNVAKKLKPYFPYAKRNLNDFQGGEGTDLQNTGKLQIQVKHYKKHVPINRLQEVVIKKRGNLPVLVSWPTDKGTGKPCVVMYFDDFLKILDKEKIQ